MPLPLIPAIGLGLSAAGFLGKLFGKSDAEKYTEQQRERLKYLRSILPGLKQKALTEGLNRIARQTQSQIAGGRQAASRRALSLGRSADAESFIVPVESEIAGRGVDAGERYTEAVGRQYDQALLNAETGFAMDVPPVEPGIGDYAVEIGALATEFGQNEELLNILSPDNPNQGMGAEFVPPEVPNFGGPFAGGFESNPVPEFLEGPGTTPNFYSDIEDKRNRKERDLGSFSYRQGGQF